MTASAVRRPSSHCSYHNVKVCAHSRCWCCHNVRDGTFCQDGKCFAASNSRDGVHNRRHMVQDPRLDDWCLVGVSLLEHSASSVAKRSALAKNNCSLRTSISPCLRAILHRLSRSGHDPLDPRQLTLTLNPPSSVPHSHTHAAYSCVH